ncbi:MAG: YCF48-related protein, partial [Bacteroidota bacterium]
MRNFFSVIALFLLMIVVAHAQQSNVYWRGLRTDIQNDPDFVDVAFVNHRIGYMVDEANNVWKTVDGGNFWKQIPLPGNLDSTWSLHRVIYSDQSTAFIIGGRRESNTPLVLRTTDGGAHWDRMTLSANVDHYVFFDISFPTPGIGYLAGGNFNGLGSVIAKTTDGGLTWNRANHSPMNGVNAHVDFRDSVHGLLINNYSQPAHGTILSTSDGGESWQNADPVAWKSRDEKWAIAHTFDGAWIASSRSDIVRSTDDGISWEESATLSPDTAHFFIDFAFTPNGIGYALAQPFAKQTLWETTDAGRT